MDETAARLAKPPFYALGQWPFGSPRIPILSAPGGRDLPENVESRHTGGLGRWSKNFIVAKQKSKGGESANRSDY